jgi:hypothetical protein
MKFHSMKMEEINRIIGELWRNTYVGTGKVPDVVANDRCGYDPNPLGEGRSKGQPDLQLQSTSIVYLTNARCVW